MKADQINSKKSELNTSSAKKFRALAKIIAYGFKPVKIQANRLGFFLTPEQKQQRKIRQAQLDNRNYQQIIEGPDSPLFKRR